MQIQSINTLPYELLNNIFLYEDERSLTKIQLVCKKWRAICQDSFFQGWKGIYLTLWNEPLPESATGKDYFNHLTFRFKAVGLTKLSKIFKQHISSVTETIQTIRHSSFFLEDVINGIEYYSKKSIKSSSNHAIDLSNKGTVSAWLTHLQPLYHQNQPAVAYLILEVFYILQSNKQTDVLNQLRSHLLDFCAEENIDSSVKELAYLALKQLFSPSSLVNHLKQIEDPWPIIYYATVHDFDFLLAGFLANQVPEIQEEASLLITTAAENKSFSCLKRLLNHQPALQVQAENLLQALCQLNERNLSRKEFEQWIGFVDYSIKAGCSLTKSPEELDEEEEDLSFSPLQLAARNANVCMLQELLNRLPQGQASKEAEDLLQHFLHFLYECRDEIGSKDESYCQLMLEILFEKNSQIKNRLNLHYLLFWHPYLLNSLVKHTQLTEHNFFNQLLETTIKLYSSHFEYALTQFGDQQSKIKNYLEEQWSMIYNQLSVLSFNLDKNLLDEHKQSIPHRLLFSLHTINKSLYETKGNLNKQNLVQQIFEHYKHLFKLLATPESLTIKNREGRTAYDLANYFNYKNLFN